MCDRVLSEKEGFYTPNSFRFYVLKNEDYLLNSWHPSTRPDSLDLSSDTAQWKHLKIITSDDNNVHFVAFFSDIVNGKEGFYFLSENSEFVKEDKWYYLKGIELKTSELTKNMPCPCQSGKKFKRCCASVF